MADIKYEIKETLIRFPGEGFHKELNLISWNEREPVYDLRGWNEDHSKMTKGVTLTEDDILFLQATLKDMEFNGKRMAMT